MENLIFIPDCEGFVTEESFLAALKNVSNVILNNGRNKAIVSGLEAYKHISKKKSLFCTEEDDGNYYYIREDREYIITILN